MINKHTHVVVGMSGGVDSSVTALLLKQQGYSVSGIFMQNWRDDDPHCPVTADLTDARTVATQLDIPFHYVNFSEEYWQAVFQLFLDEYAKGRTPNPDILCNREIKFGVLLNYVVEKLGADYLATGHYAQCIAPPVSLASSDHSDSPVSSNHSEFQLASADHSGFNLAKSVDRKKDQTYFLSSLNQAQLQRSLFPLGTLTKPEVREIAKKHGLVTNAKKDSTGICFIGERKFTEFLRNFLWSKPGDIYSAEGNKIGEHNGVLYYTIGQRQGLHIGGLRNYPDLPWFVVDKDVAQNRLIVAQGHDHPALYAQSLVATDLHWINTAPTLPFKGMAKIRYQQAEQACQLTALTASTWQVEFDIPQRAITPGQSVVFYDGQYCLGSAVIT